MTYVVSEKCIGCKHTDCVGVCPVDCFYEGSNFVAINPEECINCGLCEPECPVEAIVSEADLRAEDLYLILLNAQLAQQCSRIVVKATAPSGTVEWPMSGVRHSPAVKE